MMNSAMSMTPVARSKTSARRSPIAYPGGKWYMTKFLLPLLPPHRIYVELFGGAAHVLFAKEPAPLEVYNDIDGNLVNLFRCIRDEQKSQRLANLAYWTLISREEWNQARDTLQNEPDDVLRAFKFAVLLLQSYQLRRTAWARRKSKTRRCESTSPFEAFWHKIESARERLRHVYIEHSDYRPILDYYDGTETLFFCDPPYHPDVCAHFYSQGLTRQEHQELLERLQSVRGMVILCGRRCSAYSCLEPTGWTAFDFEVPNRNPAGVHDRTRYETVWLNPLAWERLQGTKGRLIDDE